MRGFRGKKSSSVEKIKERRSDDLQESWRRNHPSEQEENERDRRDEGRRA